MVAAVAKEMTDADRLAQMLYETAQCLESCGMIEVLPMEVYAWYESRKAKELAQEEQGQVEALKFLERRVEHWRHIATAE